VSRQICCIFIVRDELQLTHGAVNRRLIFEILPHNSQLLASGLLGPVLGSVWENPNIIPQKCSFLWGIWIPSNTQSVVQPKSTTQMVSRSFSCFL